MRLIWAVAFGLSASFAQAQNAETLADIRQDMVVLSVELQRLKQELNTTGSSGVAVGGSQLERITTIEGELQRVTAKVEELEFRIERVVKDGTKSLSNLEFRVCEMEEGCDIGSVGKRPLLGGGDLPDAPATAIAPATDALPLEGELAVSEEADFREAMQALSNDDFAGAAQMFSTFREIYPMGPLEAAALVGEGRALDGQGDVREAARRYLSAYSGFPEAKVAAEALWRLGMSLAGLGSTPEACVTLGEVEGRYPSSEFVAKAQQSRIDLGC